VQNKKVQYTSTRSPASFFPLCVDTSFHEPGEVKDVRWLYVAQRHAVQWIERGDVVASDASIVKQVQTALGVIMKVGSNSGWDAGARSMFAFERASVVSGVSFVPTYNNKAMMLGLSHEQTHDDADRTGDGIDFAWRLTANSQLEVYENGNPTGGAFGAYSAGDLLEVRVSLYGQVEYVHNRVVKYTSTVPALTSAQYPLLVDSSLYDTGAEATQVKFTLKADHNMVAWTKMSSGMSVPNAEFGYYGMIRKTSGGSAWNQGASSTASLITQGSNTYGIGFMPMTTSKAVMIGLSNGDANKVYSDIDFAIYFTGNSVTIYEKGGSVHNPNIQFTANSDVFQIRRNTLNQIEYVKNQDPPFYTSLATPNFPLLVDSSFAAVGAAIENVHWLKY
jgi:hypothetical protein